MNVLNDIYKKRLLENRSQIRYLEKYIEDLNSLDFNVYSQKLKVPILVPIGNVILFRGVIKHTNEVTVPLGADYYVKCSTKQADIIRRHRIKVAKSKLEKHKKEKEYLENQIAFGAKNLDENSREDIIETCSEEEDKAWRKQHREKVKQYHQSNEKKEVYVSDPKTDEELWMRLEELELQEELQNELDKTNKSETNDLDESKDNSFDSFVIKKDEISNIDKNQTEKEENQEPHTSHNIPKQTSKADFIQQVLERQKMLENKLTEIKNRQKVEFKTESDLISRIDEIEQLDELEDEMNRIDGMLIGSSDDEAAAGASALTIKRSISFADEDVSKTLELTFKHSDIEPSKEPYTSEKGITKPSDMYDAYSKLFTNEKTSILKKSKYDIDLNVLNNNFIHNDMQPNIPVEEKEKNTIAINDVKEITDKNQLTVGSNNRPTSLFKKKRQQQKT